MLQSLSHRHGFFISGLMVYHWRSDKSGRPGLHDKLGLELNNKGFAYLINIPTVTC